MPFLSKKDPFTSEMVQSNSHQIKSDFISIRLFAAPSYD